MARDVLLVVLMTVCCLLPSEVVGLQLCDLLSDFDCTHSNDPSFQGTAAVLVRQRKNDQIRKMHFPRIGRSKDPTLDVVFQLKTFARLALSTTHPLCTKEGRMKDRCQWCPPLFPRFQSSKSGPLPTARHLRRQQVRDIVQAAMSAIGLDPSRFSAVSARKGGLSVAIEHQVPECVLWLQSGHAQSVAARRYIHLSSPLLLFHTWAAFDL